MGCVLLHEPAVESVIAADFLSLSTLANAIKFSVGGFSFC